MNMKLLRLVGILEGLSAAALFFVAMPMKYMMNNPSLVPPVGMAHGVLFLVFLVVLLAVSHQKGWSIGTLLLGIFCAIIPCGTFFFDWKINRMENDLDEDDEDEDE